MIEKQPREVARGEYEPEGAATESVVCGESVEVLRHLVQAAGLSFDVLQASQALREAELEIPPTVPRAARLRITQAASRLGLQILSRQLSVQEALGLVEPSKPLAIFAVRPDGTARWHLLVDRRGRRGKLARLASSDPTGWLDANQIAAEIGATSAEVVLEWLSGEPMAPLAEASALMDRWQTLPTEEEHHGLPPLQRLIGLLRPEARDIAVVVIFAIGVGMLSLAVPITVTAVVNTTALATLLQQLLVLCLALLISLGLAAVLRALQSVVVEYMQQRIFVRVVADLSYRLPRIDITAFDRHHAPKTLQHLPSAAASLTKALILPPCSSTFPYSLAMHADECAPHRRGSTNFRNNCASSKIEL